MKFAHASHSVQIKRCVHIMNMRERHADGQNFDAKEDKKVKASKIFGVALALICSVCTTDVVAVSLGECSGTLIKWSSGGIPPRFRASQISFPTGNAFTNALSNVIGNWNRNPSSFSFNLTLGDSAIRRDNGQSEVWFSIDQDVLDGAPALAMTWYDDCDEIVEVGDHAGAPVGTQNDPVQRRGEVDEPLGIEGIVGHRCRPPRRHVSADRQHDPEPRPVPVRVGVSMAFGFPRHGY